MPVKATLGTATGQAFPSVATVDPNDAYGQAVNDFGMPTILIDGYPIDCTVTEGHDYSSEVTEYPVEKGGDVTDHVRPKPLKITLDGYVSATPIGVVAQHPTRKDGNLPVDNARAKLLAVRDNAEPVNITTSLDSYKSMLLESLSFPRESGEPDWLHFKATFVQVILVTNKRTTIRTATPGGQRKQTVGERLAKLGIPFASVFTLTPKNNFTVTVYGVTFKTADVPILIDKTGKHYVIHDGTPPSDGFVIGDNSVKGLTPGYHPWFGTHYDPTTGFYTNDKGYVTAVNPVNSASAKAARDDLEDRLYKNAPPGFLNEGSGTAPPANTWNSLGTAVQPF